MPPTAQRTVYVRRAHAEPEPVDSGSEVDRAGRGGGGQEVEETATGAAPGKFGRARGQNAAESSGVGRTVTVRHHARNWGRERNSKVGVEGRTMDSTVGGEEKGATEVSRYVARYWTLEREAKYQAKKMKREEARTTTSGIDTLIGPASVKHLDGQTVRRGVLSKFSSIDVPTAVGITTIATGSLDTSILTRYAPSTMAGNHHMTTKGPPAIPVATPSVSHGERRVDGSLPASYIISWYAILAFLMVMWSLAVVLYLVNFPPRFLSRSNTARKYRKKQYAKVPEDTGREHDQEIGSAAFTTSSDTPSLTSPCLRTRRQRSQEHGDIDAVGLGIELSDRVPKRQRSFINTSHKPRPEPPVSASMPQTAPLPARSQFDKPSTIVFNHTQDLENGLTVPDHTYDSAYLPPHRLSPYSPPSEPCSRSSSRSASPHRVLKKVGDGIEYFAGKAARMMNDQVKADPEEDLLLPVRDCERERLGEGMEKLY